jgi:hypothetical protein
VPQSKFPHGRVRERAGRMSSGETEAISNSVIMR